MTQTEAPQTTKCSECDRTLRTAKSVAAGIGPVCAARKAAALNLAAAFKDPQAAANKALQIIADKAIVPTRIKGQYLTVSSDGTQNYLTDVVDNTCTCKAGARLGRCSHLVAANVLQITTIRRNAAYALAA